MSNKLELEHGDVVFILDTMKVLGNTLKDRGLDDVEDLLIESEGILNTALESIYEDIDLRAPVRFTAA